MSHHPPSFSLVGIPPELVHAVAVDAARDAELVAVFLGELGIKRLPSEVFPLQRHARFLLDLGAALRLLIWEHKGLTVHLEAGLPSATEAIKEVFRRINSDDEPASEEPPISMLVVKLFIDRFSWHAKIEWRADVVLDFLDEDAAVEVIAEFLWRNRHTLPKQ